MNWFHKYLLIPKNHSQKANGLILPIKIKVCNGLLVSLCNKRNMGESL